MNKPPECCTKRCINPDGRFKWAEHVSVSSRKLGPKEIAARAAQLAQGTVVSSVSDLLEWIRQTKPAPNTDGLTCVTFVIDEQGRLRVADRRSEHIACSCGNPVLSAGEMFLSVNGEAVEVSNQSTGFCPEPESWPAVAAAFDAAGIHHSGRFTTEIVYRRCPSCGERSIVKGNWFICEMCGAALPEGWNC